MSCLMKKNTLNNWEKEKKKKQISVTKCFHFGLASLKIIPILLIQHCAQSLGESMAGCLTLKSRLFWFVFGTGCPESWGCHILGVLRTRWKGALHSLNCWGVASPWQGLALDGLWDLFQPSHSVVLWFYDLSQKLGTDSNLFLKQ